MSLIRCWARPYKLFCFICQKYFPAEFVNIWWARPGGARDWNVICLCVGSSLLVYINKTYHDITDLVKSSSALPRHEVWSISCTFECSGAGCSVLLMEVTPVYLENPPPGNYWLNTHISSPPSSPHHSSLNSVWGQLSGARRDLTGWEHFRFIYLKLISSYELTGVPVLIWSCVADWFVL